MPSISLDVLGCSSLYTRFPSLVALQIWVRLTCDLGLAVRLGSRAVQAERFGLSREARGIKTQGARTGLGDA